MFKNRIYGERFTNIGMIFRPADCAWGKRALLLFASFAFGLTAAFAAATPFEKMSANPLPDISGAGFANAPSPQKGFPISGSVVDEDGNPVSGVTVVEKANPANGTVSNSNGEFSIHVPDQNSVLAFSFLGYEPQELVVGDRRILSIMLKTAAQEMEDVVVVGFGTQKKESLVSAIATVKPSELKGPTSNLTTMIGGQVAGMISYQRSGEPGQDNAEFFIRGVGSFGAGKVNPLILIDGIESSSTDLARLQPDDIADFSVLKDATASAVYGARGANGVVLVNTKSGREGKTQFNFRAENSISTNTRNFRFADNITYMQLANEAVLTRNPQSPLTYSKDKIEHTRRGDNPVLYPNNDWIDQLIKPSTMNQRFNANISGGGRVARFYLAGTFNIDNGVLRNDNGNDFKNNISLKNYSIRSNTDLQLTKTTVATVRVYAQFDDYHGPIGGGEKIFNSAMAANPVAFPAVYPQSYSPTTTHPMFGSALTPNSTGQLYTNPYAQMVSGYQVNNASTINAQIEFKQDFGFWVPGLTARAMGYTQRYSFFSTTRQYNPFYYKADLTSQGVVLTPFNDGGNASIGTPGTEYLNYNEGEKKVSTAYYGEAVINYDRTFADKHQVTGMLIGTIRHSIVGNAGTLEGSLPSRNLGLSGRFTYGFDSRYLLEFNFGYNGSERFSSNKRWGFFPSIGGGWVVSNEKFFAPLKKVISDMKLRVSYGLIGNDQIGDVNDRFFYLSNVNLNQTGDRSQVFGENFLYGRPGVETTRYANYDIGWEESRQLNLGLDMKIGGVNIIVEPYWQERSNILLDRTYIPATMGLSAKVKANTGKAKSHGVDVSVDYNKFFRSGLWTTLRGNFTYATNEITVYDEPNYPANEYYRSRLGYPFAQTWGYVAERLFVDDEEVANSPSQKFGDIPVAAGDIKYRDINGDGQITEADKIPIGFPTTPEINYGFGGTIGYKNFDLSLFFQGSARSSIFIDAEAISPFVMKTDQPGNQNGLLRVVANDHWSEDNRNLYAFWPRLSDRANENNTQVSTWWMRNGAMLRLKSLELGYNLPEKAARKIGMTKLRVYVNASNLFVISNFKLWDPEMGANGLGYPLQRVFNIGLSIGL